MVVVDSEALEGSLGAATRRPTLSFRQIWNMCFGFLGLQFGFALQNANVSRIFQTLGASLDQIPALWVAAPLTGLIVQPIIGYFSDRTWTRLGRRRPYFLAGAVLAAAALVAMPLSRTLWIAAALLWLLDASINVSMEPFRAFVADQLGPAQRATGYAMQSFFIGFGAVVASLMPWLLTRAGVSNLGAAGDGKAGIPDTVRWSFDFGAAVLLFAVIWTVCRTREYSPARLQSFSEADARRDAEPQRQLGARPDLRADGGGRSSRRKLTGALWCLLGGVALCTIRYLRLDPQLYLLGAGSVAWGVARLFHRSGGRGLIHGILEDLARMPPMMRRLVPVQFFSWLALFSMWIYTTAAVAQRQFGSTDPNSLAYNEGANWVGVLFGAYNGFAALAALCIPLMVRRFGISATHRINLGMGGLALISFLFVADAHWLLVPMLGIGFAWASILSLPYALLSDSIPAQKMGVYMGIFNFFIVIPQLVAASVLGFLLKVFFGGEPVYALVLGGASFLLAGALTLRLGKREQ
jgi:maltose/moltooligosaccharide transporter